MISPSDSRIPENPTAWRRAPPERAEQRTPVKTHERNNYGAYSFPFFSFLWPVGQRRRAGSRVETLHRDAVKGARAHNSNFQTKGCVRRVVVNRRVALVAFRLRGGQYDERGTSVRRTRPLFARSTRTRDRTARDETSVRRTRCFFLFSCFFHGIAGWHRNGRGATRFGSPAPFQNEQCTLTRLVRLRRARGSILRPVSSGGPYRTRLDTAIGWNWSSLSSSDPLGVFLNCRDRDLSVKPLHDRTTETYGKMKIPSAVRSVRRQEITVYVSSDSFDGCLKTSVVDECPTIERFTRFRFFLVECTLLYQFSLRVYVNSIQPCPCITSTYARAHLVTLLYESEQ